MQRRLEPDDAFEQTAFFRDWVRPQGLHDACNTPVIQRPRFTALLSPWTDRARRPLDDADLDAIRLITPHLRRAILIGDLIADTAGTAALQRAMLDRIAVPAIVTGLDGRILTCNAAGEAMLARADMLTRRAGRIEATHPAARAALSAALAAATDETAEDARGGGIPLGPPEAASDAVAYVLPLGRSPLRRSLGDGIAAVFVGGGAAMQPTAPELVAALTGLTSAEARVALALAEGQDTETAAAALGITPNTLRKHLANIFDKTGLRNRAALAARVARIVVPLVADRPGHTPYG